MTAGSASSNHNNTGAAKDMPRLKKIG